MHRCTCGMRQTLLPLGSLTVLISMLKALLSPATNNLFNSKLLKTVFQNIYNAYVPIPLISYIKTCRSNVKKGLSSRPHGQSGQSQSSIPALVNRLDASRARTASTCAAALGGAGGDSEDTPVKQKSFKVAAFYHNTNNKPSESSLKCLMGNRSKFQALEGKQAGEEAEEAGSGEARGLASRVEAWAQAFLCPAWSRGGGSPLTSASHRGIRTVLLIVLPCL